jgi:hypothetical protein
LVEEHPDELLFNRLAAGTRRNWPWRHVDSIGRAAPSQ